MEFSNINSITDFKEYITPISLTASTNADLGEFKWAVWNLQKMDSNQKNSILLRYPNVPINEPHLFYYCEKQKEDKKFVTIGIVFPISIVVKAEFGDNTMTAYVKPNGFYWRYSRIDERALHVPFANFRGFDASFISTELAAPSMMDSQSPSHPKTL